MTNSGTQSNSKGGNSNVLSAVQKGNQVSSVRAALGGDGKNAGANPGFMSNSKTNDNKSVIGDTKVIGAVTRGVPGISYIIAIHPT